MVSNLLFVIELRMHSISEERKRLEIYNVSPVSNNLSRHLPSKNQQKQFAIPQTISILSESVSPVVSSGREKGGWIRIL